MAMTFETLSCQICIYLCFHACVQLSCVKTSCQCRERSFANNIKEQIMQLRSNYTNFISLNYFLRKKRPDNYPGMVKRIFGCKNVMKSKLLKKFINVIAN